jgi:hypothetical protein
MIDATEVIQRFRLVLRQIGNDAYWPGTIGRREPGPKADIIGR